MGVALLFSRAGGVGGCTRDACQLISALQIQPLSCCGSPFPGCMKLCLTYSLAGRRGLCSGPIPRHGMSLPCVSHPSSALLCSALFSTSHTKHSTTLYSTRRYDEAWGAAERADTRLKCCDGVIHHVHSQVLSLWSTVLRNMIVLIPSPQLLESTHGLAFVLNMEEGSAAWSAVLDVMYPVVQRGRLGAPPEPVLQRAHDWVSCVWWCARGVCDGGVVVGACCWVVGCVALLLGHMQPSQ